MDQVRRNAHCHPHSSQDERAILSHAQPELQFPASSVCSFGPYDRIACKSSSWMRLSESPQVCELLRCNPVAIRHRILCNLISVLAADADKQELHPPML